WPNRRVQTRPPNAMALKPTTVRSANSQSGRSSMRRRASFIRPAPSAFLILGKEPRSISSSSNSNQSPAKRPTVSQQIRDESELAFKRLNLNREYGLESLNPSPQQAVSISNAYGVLIPSLRPFSIAAPNDQATLRFIP